jgi:hypothetical protein
VKALWLLLALGCAGAANDPPVDEMTDGDATPEAPAVEVAPAAPAKAQIPLCDGSPEEAPELCQRLVYGSHGYCNRWIVCP